MLRLDLPRYRYQCTTKTSIQTTNVTLDKMATPITIPNLTSTTLGSTKRITNSYTKAPKLINTISTLTTQIKESTVKTP